MSENILKCPFCGSKSSLKEEEVFWGNKKSRFWVACDDPKCNVTCKTRKSESKEDVIKIWNNRGDYRPQPKYGKQVLDEGWESNISVLPCEIPALISVLNYVLYRDQEKFMDPNSDYSKKLKDLRERLMDSMTKTY